MTKLATRQTLLDALAEAAGREPSESELRSQRVSFVMGVIGQKNDATRERVERVLAEQDGRKVVG